MNMDIIITIIVVRPQRVIIPMDQVMNMDTTMGVTVTLDKKIGQERMDTQHLRSTLSFAQTWSHSYSYWTAMSMSIQIYLLGWLI